MSLTQSRWILIDDSAADVSYSGNWFVDTYAKPGPFQLVGSATEGTAHGTNSSGGFSFSFEGTKFLARGQSNVIPASTNSALRCTVDGVEGESDVVNAGNLKSWQLCTAENLREGLHMVVVSINAGPNTIFWLDEIYYFSLSPPNLRQKRSMLYPTTDEARYSGVSWTNPFDQAGRRGRESYQNGAKVTLPFYGASVELAGYMTSSMPRVPGEGSYSIDGEPPVRFETPTWISGFRGLGSNETITRHTIFTTPPVSPGHHTLEIVNFGNSSTVPLTIDHFIVNHGDVNATTAAAAKPDLNTNPNTAHSPMDYSDPSGLTTSPKKNVGLIVGATVGAVVLLAALSFLFFWNRKRRLGSVRRSKTIDPLPSRWAHGEYAALDPRGVPVDVTPPYQGAPGTSGGDTTSPPQYTASAQAIDSTFQQATVNNETRSSPKKALVMHYQRTASTDSSAEQMGPTT